MDDIIDRLKDQSLQLARRSFDSVDAGLAANVADAAIDEIERLREELLKHHAQTPPKTIGRQWIIDLIREQFDPTPSHWKAGETGWDDGAETIAESILANLPLLRAEHSTVTSTTRCRTCDGRGVVGGFVSADSGYQTDPCPDCALPSNDTNEKGTTNGRSGNDFD